jgi:hypothetical protein
MEARSETWPAGYPSSYWSIEAVQEAKRRGARSHMWALCWRGRSRIFVIEERPTYTHCEFFAVWQAAVAKFSFLTTGPPHARPLQSDGLMLDWIAVPDFLGDLSISAAAFTKYSNHAGFCNGPLLSKKGSWGWCHLRR